MMGARLKNKMTRYLLLLTAATVLAGCFRPARRGTQQRGHRRGGVEGRAARLNRQRQEEYLAKQKKAEDVRAKRCPLELRHQNLFHDVLEAAYEARASHVPYEKQDFISINPSRTHRDLAEYDAKLRDERCKEFRSRPVKIYVSGMGEVTTSFQTEWEFSVKSEAEREVVLAARQKASEAEQARIASENEKWYQACEANAKKRGLAGIIKESPRGDGGLLEVVQELTAANISFSKLKKYAVELASFADRDWKALQALKKGSALYTHPDVDLVVILQGFRGHIIEGSALLDLGIHFFQVVRIKKYKTAMRTSRQALVVKVVPIEPR